MLEKLWQWLEQQKDACSESSALGKADRLHVEKTGHAQPVLEDGALPLNNNRCERAIGLVVMG